MRLATWNVNSIRTRVDRVVDWLERSDTDVLAMQEIKCKPEQFPLAAFEAAGYEVAIHGLNQWNGVAIASRVGLADVETSFPNQPAFGKPGQDPIVEARAIGATAGGVRVWSLYVPNGRGLADPHYAYKLEFLRTLREAAAGWTDQPVALAGDWNVAPTSEDIWSEEDSDAETHVSQASRAEIAAYADAGYTELSRLFLPDPHTYTFWDYQRLAFPKNEGMRIDFIFASQPLVDRTTDVQIVRDERKGKGASDHVPVVATVDAQ